ncbi:hypothetical protein M0R04_12940 [Candidatus Dojkabacteria bacterium]|nr:hypothetical protein [Candidatus Dojkabacteria bacterium]
MGKATIDQLNTLFELYDDAEVLYSRDNLKDITKKEADYLIKEQTMFNLGLTNKEK